MLYKHSQNLDVTLKNKEREWNPKQIEFEPEMTEFTWNRLRLCILPKDRTGLWNNNEVKL